MKKIGLIALVLAIALSLCACRRKNNTQPAETVPKATEDATMPSILPDPAPTMETNIPDPSVDSNTQGDNYTSDATTSSDESAEQTEGISESESNRSRVRRIH